MNPVINSVGQSGCSGDYSNKTAGLPQDKESAGTYAGRPVSVHENQDVQPSIQKPIGHEDHSGLTKFKVRKHEKPPSDLFYSLRKRVWIAEMEKLHHPCLVLKISSHGANEFIEGCLDFKKLLNCRIDIIPLKSGCGFYTHPIPTEDGSKKGKVKMESENGETIITFTGDHGFKPTKLYINNEYWRYYNINELIGKYKSLNLM